MAGKTLNHMVVAVEAGWCLAGSQGQFNGANAKVVALVSQPGKAAVTVRFALK